MEKRTLWLIVGAALAFLFAIVIVKYTWAGGKPPIGTSLMNFALPPEPEDVPEER